MQRPNELDPRNICNYPRVRSYHDRENENVFLLYCVDTTASYSGGFELIHADEGAHMRAESSLHTVTSSSDTNDNAGATVNKSCGELVPIRHADVLQLSSPIERGNPIDELPFILPIGDPVGPTQISVLGFINRHTTQVPHQSALVAHAFVVVIWVMNNLIQHDTVSKTALIVVVDHLQQGLKPELPTGSVYVRVLALEVTCHFLKLRFKRDGVEVSETKSQRSTVR